MRSKLTVACRLIERRCISIWKPTRFGNPLAQLQREPLELAKLPRMRQECSHTCMKEAWYEDARTAKSIRFHYP